MKKAGFVPILGIGFSLAVSAARQLLPWFHDKTLLCLLLHFSAYLINVATSGQRDFKRVELMGIPLAVLTGVAAMVGWVSWVVPVMHIVLTLACSAIKAEDPDPGWTQAQKQEFYANRHSPFYRRHHKSR